MSAQSDQATFRGVPFFVGEAELGGGREGARHKFPLRDASFREDLGRSTREFPVEGYVVGEDYKQQRDALLAALEAYGPGELKHPAYGTRRVAVSAFRTRETNRELRMATFSITFEETEVAPKFPAAAPAPRQKIDATGDAIVEALRARADAAGEVTLATSALGSLSSVVEGASAAVQSALGPLLAVADELADLKRQIADVLLDVAILARQPAEVLSAFVEIFDSLPSLPARAGVYALIEAYAFSPSSARPPATTAAREREQEIFDLLLTIVRTSMLVHAAKLAAVAVFDSYDDAVAARDAIAAALDEQAAVADDATFAQLEQLRADLLLAVPGDSKDLPRLVKYTPAFSVPSLVLAHRLYGSVAREGDIVLRNAVKRPGFCMGGVELEVLSDE